jgi:hypothetical protein
VSAAPQNEKQTRQELQAWYGKIISAYKNKDLKAYLALHAPDFQNREFQGKTMDRKAVEAYVKEDMASTGPIHSARLDIAKLTLNGSEATVVGTETLRLVFTDRRGYYGPKGKSYDTFWRSRWQQRFVKTPRGWLARYRQTTAPDTFTAGGKPLVLRTNRGGGSTAGSNSDSGQSANTAQTE